MNLHISFGDGKPFVRKEITVEQLGYEITHWSRNYELRYIGIRLEDTTLFIGATEKGAEA